MKNLVMGGLVCLVGGVSGGGLLVDLIVRLVVFVNVSSVRSRGLDARFCSYLRLWVLILWTSIFR